MTPTLISVTNDSSTLSDEEVAAVVLAVGRQLAQHVAPIWGAVPAIEFVSKGGPVEGCPCSISDTPDVADALGYHDEGPDGVPYIKVFVIPGNDWRVTLSHEVLELALDAAANLWADGPDGLDYAREACDADQGGTYTIDGVSVSNFVYPAFFDPKAGPDEKLDYMDRLSRPFMTGPDGYQIVRTEPGRISDTFGMHLDGAAHIAEAAPGLHLIFGSRYPESQKAHKIAMAAKKRGGRRHNHHRSELAPPPREEDGQSYVAHGTAETWDGREETSR